VVVVSRALAIACVVLFACEPNLNQRTSAVTSARVLAVRSDPAEAPPGGKVTLSSLYVDAAGPIAKGPFDWAFCDAQNPLANLGPVNPACTEEAGSVFLELGDSPSETSPLPMDACREFGPDVPAAQANEPPGRPVDPDSTGGYYDPVRLLAGDQVAIGMVRVTCDFPGASPAQLTQLAAENHTNTNPSIDSVSDTTLGTLALAGKGTSTVAPSQRLELLASWASCDPAATSCTGSEGYAYLDPVTHEVISAREQMRVSWFASGGAFDNDRTGRDATDSTPNTSNGWVAPAAAGPVNIWVVLRDDRGGVGWRSYAVTVK
jgi:hypothetical protein